MSLLRIWDGDIESLPLCIGSNQVIRIVECLTLPGVVVSGILPVKASGLRIDMGYQCIEVDTSEFLKAGGSVRCMTLDL